MAATDYYDTISQNQSVEGLSGMFQYIQAISDGAFFMAIMFVIWIVGFLALKGYSSAKAFLTTSLFCSVLTIVLAVLEMINPQIMYLFIFLTAVGFVWVKLDSD